MKMLNKIIGGSIAVAAALAFSASTTQAASLLVNGSFETALPQTPNPITLSGVNQGWTTFNGAGSAAQSDMSSSADSPQDGIYALLETAGPGNNWNPAGAYQIISGITPGQTYTFSIWALTDTVNDTYGNNTAGVLFQLGFGNFTNPTNSQQFVSLGSSVSPDPHLPTINTWTQYTATGVAPAGATDASVYAMFQDNGSATVIENLYYDNASLIAVPEPSSLALVGMGLAIPFYFIRRRKI